MPKVVTAQQALAQAIIRRLKAAGFEAYLAGGCVRDHLLGIEPKDYDVATSATPDDIETMFEHITPVGRAFGVMMVHDVETPQVNVEVATFRSDGEYKDGRRPETVVFSSAREDAVRRDFTINGMFMDPTTGEVIDYVGGRADLEARVIRAIGDPVARFTEDRLRLLRGIRFACRYSFSIDDATYAAMGQLAPGLKDVSAERIRNELEGMIHGPARGRAIRELAETGLLDVALPRLANAPEGVTAVARTASMLDMADRDRLGGALAWSLLLHACAGAPTGGALPEDAGVVAASVMRGLAQSTSDTTMVKDTLEAVGGALLHKDASLEAVKRFLRGRGVAQALEIDRLLGVWDDMHGDADARERIAIASSALRAFAHYSAMSGLGGLNPPPILDGRAVMALGVPPGARVGVALRLLEDEVLAERLHTSEAAEAMVRAWIAEGKV